MSGDVLKFGGSSVSSARNIDKVAGIIVDHYLSNLNKELNIVTSAVGIAPGVKGNKVTDMLLDLADIILKGGDNRAAEDQISRIGEMHSEIVRRLPIDHRIYFENVYGLRSIAWRATNNEMSNPNQLQDLIVSFGELTSTPIVAEVVQKKLEDALSTLEDKLNNGGLSAEERKAYERLKSAEGAYTHVVEPGDVGFVTDSNFTKASLLDESIDEEIGRHYMSLRAKNQNRILFYPGFVAKNKEGKRTTIGRDGSNTTATALGAAINANQIMIYSDTDGVLLVSPKIVRGSQTARVLWHKEVVELAKYGGMKVLEDAALYPIFRKGRSIPIIVKNTFNPNDPGTLITHESDDSATIMKGIGVIPGVHYAEFVLNGISDYQAIENIYRAHPGVKVIRTNLESDNGQFTAKFVFGTNAKFEKINGDFMEGLYQEVKRGIFNGVTPKGYHYSAASLVTIVGKGLGSSLGDISKIYKILDGVDWGKGEDSKKYRFPVWQTRDSVHVLIRDKNVDEVVNRLYSQLKKVNIVLYGLGNVGQEFLDRVIKSYDELRLNVVGVVDSSGGYAKIGGFTTKDLESIVAFKRNGSNLGRARGDELVDGGVYLKPEEAKNFQNVHNFGKGDFVLVDATGDPSMIHRQLHALHLGASVISVNKTPYALGNDFNDATRKIPKLFEALFENRLFNRGTVGANIGVPGKLLDILSENPDYVTIRGCMSGTLGYTSTLLDEGKALSEGILGAIEKKYTEPNPFLDYSGRDVLNKMLVLWRTIATKYGMGLFDVDINHESFIEPAIRKYEQMSGNKFETSDLSQLTEKEFTERMKLLDEPFRDLQKDLREGYVLRYVGEIKYGKGLGKYSISVGLKQVQKESPLGVLRGPDNRVLFGINRPSEDPQVVVAGPGAGVEVTAESIINDLKDVVKIAGGDYGGRKVDYKKRQQFKPFELYPSSLGWFPPSKKAKAILGDSSLRSL